MGTNHNIVQMNQLSGVHQDGEGVLGKILYYSLSSLLVDKERLQKICSALGFPHTPSRRLALSDAFKSATGDIYDRKAVKGYGGQTTIYRVYCRDNKQSVSGILSRELVKETLGAETNEYKKLANISFYKESQLFAYDNLAYDEHVDPLEYCQQAAGLFELYQRCAGRKQIETILENYLATMEAVKVVSHGKVYFVPRSHMQQLELFEDFIIELERANENTNPTRPPLDSNSMYVVDDAKQCEKMAAAFYHNTRREIEECQQRMDYLLESGCESPAILDRWVLKTQALVEKKRNYEDVLHRELDGLDDELQSLQYLSDEFKIRANGIQRKRAA